MSLRQQLEVLEKISEVATLAGMRGEINEEALRFEAGFELPDNRNQIVYVRPLDESIGDSAVVTFFSPCVAIKSGFMKGISKDMALDLLARNEQTLFARYGVWLGQGADMIVASVDHLLDSLDPEEFRAHMWYVALAADNYEKEFGVDDY